MICGLQKVSYRTGKPAQRYNMATMKRFFPFAAPLRLYLYNVFFCKIPFNSLRLFFVKQYLQLGKKSNVCAHVRILKTSLQKAQIQIGNHCVIEPDCLLDGREGRIIIGNNVDIARGTWIFTMEHDPHSDTYAERHADVRIEDSVWIASRVIILPGVTIGKGSVIAAGAVVSRDIPPMSIAAGVPARVIGGRKSALNYRHDFFPSFYR